MHFSQDVDCLLKEVVDKLCLEEENKNSPFKYLDTGYKKWLNFEDIYTTKTEKNDHKNTVLDLNKALHDTGPILNYVRVNSDLQEDDKFFKKLSSKEGFEITNSSLGFGDLSSMKSSCNISLTEVLQQNTKLNCGNDNDSEIKFTKENDLQNLRMLTSTPIKESEGESCNFITKDYTKYKLSVELYEKGDNDEYLNKTIDEAIDKYQNVEEEDKFKEVSVQTTFNGLFTAECQCALYKLKSEEKEDLGSISFACPPLKKAKIDVFEDFSLHPNGMDCQSVCTELANFENLEKHLNSEMTEVLKDHTKAFPEKNRANPAFFNTTLRIRVGLSKRAKLQPLHKK